MTKQRKWQIARKKEGRCENCGNTNDRKNTCLCSKCNTRHRSYCRNKYREKHNISLDTPVKKGRPRYENNPNIIIS